jgi:hypothetical protein
MRKGHRVSHPEKTKEKRTEERGDVAYADTTEPQSAKGSTVAGGWTLDTQRLEREGGEECTSDSRLIPTCADFLSSHNPTFSLSSESKTHQVPPPKGRLILRDRRPGSPKAQPRLPQGLLPRRQADGGAGFADIGGGDGSVEGRTEYGYGYESGYQSLSRSFRKRTVLILSSSLSLQFVEIFMGNM